jgi:uncharacterized protein (DUF4415 family)
MTVLVGSIRDFEAAAYSKSSRAFPRGLSRDRLSTSIARIEHAADTRQAAEAAFKKATTKLPEPVAKQTSVPNARELVSLRIDRDVLEYF